MTCRWCKKPEPPDDWQHGVSADVIDEMYCWRYWNSSSMCRLTERYAVDHLLDLIEASEDVLTSFENYSLERKPVEERDEYDHTMAPKWERLRRILKNIRDVS